MLVALFFSSPFAVPLGDHDFGAWRDYFCDGLRHAVRRGEISGTRRDSLAVYYRDSRAIILAILVLADYPTMQTMTIGTIIMAAVLWYQWRLAIAFNRKARLHASLNAFFTQLPHGSLAAFFQPARGVCDDPFQLATFIEMDPDVPDVCTGPAWLWW